MKKHQIDIPKVFMNFILIMTFSALIIGCAFSNLATVSATGVTIYTNDTTPISSHILTVAHPSTSVGNSAGGIAFTATNTGYVSSINVYLHRYSTIDSTLQCVIENITGSIDDETGEPAYNDILAVSTDTIDSDDLTTSAAQYTFHFAQTLQLVAGENYTVSVWMVSYRSGDGNVRVGADFYDSATNNGFYYHNSLYTTTSVAAIVSIYGDTSPAASPTPTPTADPSATAAPPVELTNIWATVGSLIQLIVPLMVVVLPAFFGYKFAGAWGFLAGINIGAILAYVILGATVFPLWGIVVILILDALLLFGKVGFHS